MPKVENIIIGFGQGGKALAQDLGNRGESTILVEKDPKMYGGTCVNVACIPSKRLATLAKRRPDTLNKRTYYQNAIQEKKRLIQQLNKANYKNVNDTKNVSVIDGEASFINEDKIKIRLKNGDLTTYEAKKIFINTGSRPNVPNIPGLKIDGRRIHTSETLMDDERFTEHLTIIGDGNVGLEFASIYSQFGSQVTVLSHSSQAEFLKSEEKEIREAVLKAMQEMGIRFIFNAETTQVNENNTKLSLTYKQKDTTKELNTDKILVAVGRSPNIKKLNLNAAGILLTEDDAVQVNKHLQTNIKHIFALGDVNGGPQHTYISSDDYRIVKSKLFDDGSYNLATRENVPAATFIDPPLATVGLTEKESKQHGYHVKIALLPANSIAQAKILDHTVGLYKTVIDADTEEILGASFFAEDSHEVINIISTAMAGKLAYHTLANQIFPHPTMAEALNNLFGQIT